MSASWRTERRVGRLALILLISASVVLTILTFPGRSLRPVSAIAYFYHAGPLAFTPLIGTVDSFLHLDAQHAIADCEHTVEIFCQIMKHTSEGLWHYRKPLTDQQRYVLAGSSDNETRLRLAKSLSDSQPNNPAFYAWYVSEYLSEEIGIVSAANPPPRRPLRDVLSVLDWGERMEPDNGWYNFRKAAVLIQRASSLYLPDRHPRMLAPSSQPAVMMGPGMMAQLVNPANGVVRQPPSLPYEVRNLALFNQGVAELRKGLTKPRCDSHRQEIGDIRWALWTPVLSANDYFDQYTALSWISAPEFFSGNSVSEPIIAQALTLARKKDTQGATRLFRDMMTFCLRFRDLECLSNVLEHAGYTKGIPGWEQPSANYRRQLSALETFRKSLPMHSWRDRERLQNRYGLLSILVPLPLTPEPNPRPAQIAEHVVFLRASLSYLMTVLMVMVVLFALITLVSFHRHRFDNRGPQLLIIPWYQWAKVLFLAVVVPIVAYGVYFHWACASGWMIGVPASIPRLVLESGLATGMIFWLVLRFSFSAVCQTADPMGLKIPLRSRTNLVFVAVVLVLLMLGSYQVVIWHLLTQDPNFSYDPQRMYFVKRNTYLLLGAFELLLTLWLVLKLRWLRHLRGSHAVFRRNVIFSCIPILTVAVILLGVLGHLSLRYAEAVAVAQLPTPMEVSLRYANAQAEKHRRIDQFIASFSLER